MVVKEYIEFTSAVSTPAKPTIENIANCTIRELFILVLPWQFGDIIWLPHHTSRIVNDSLHDHTFICALQQEVGRTTGGGE